ncbi:MAG: ornithine carbamoyltransferase [Chitinivibrionales bacterium]|nr:ornithine carbamoyltransferase [Chitinivibrionales bacterium]MBD3356631.1 ornithine carbamoyltransferase [Chitinivibrionales bacterium]
MAASTKDLITLIAMDPEEIRDIIRQAAVLKKERNGGDVPEVMRGRTGVMIFEKPSLRTRITFETAIYELGGHSINLQSNMVQIGKRESVEDVARNLERWVHLIVARTYLHDTVVQLARHASIPVINALTDQFHPCQALAFGLTVHEHFNEPESLTVAFIGDGNNVCCSLMALCAKLGYHFRLACPKGYEPSAQLVSQCSETAARNGASVDISNDPQKAVTGALAVYTDVWTSMGQETESERRKSDFARFQLNRALLAHAPSDAIVSHCLPAHRGEEITGEVLDSSQSVAFDEAENRLHAQKAAIVHLLARK